MTNPEARSFTGREARKLLRRARRAALGTLDRDTGIPYVSAVNVATDWRGAPFLLLSRLARHTQNLAADPRASILVSELAGEGDALTGPRTTWMGKFEQLDDEQLRNRYLRLHPYATGYAQFADFAFWRLIPENAHAVAGFGRIETLSVDEFMLPDTVSQAWQSLEGHALDHMNADHRDAVRDYARGLLHLQEGDWTLAALDPDGGDLVSGEKFARLEFEKPALDPVALRLELVHLAEKARSKAT
jgi:putative heme iron utilization protein